MDSYTVSEINDVIKKALQIEFKNKMVTVTGEISNVKSSGRHTYLTLKDDNTSIQVVFWSTQLDNEHGDNVEITGRIEHYIKNGNVNLIGNAIKIIGVGTLHAEYEKIKNNYDQKGYFNNRKPLPSSVKKIGIVTSEGGAALQDFIYVLEKNNFSGDVYVYDCIAQGTRCPASVAAGVKFFNSSFFVDDTNNKTTNTIVKPKTTSSKKIKKHNSSESSDEFDPFATSDKVKHKINRFINDSDEIEVDIVVVTRGGGSFEDLMGFSHPKVIDAIYNSKKYIISAVGHEIDNMLSDYVANYRAPTPSIAGEVVCSINDDNRKRLTQLEHKTLELRHAMLQELFRFKNNLKRLTSGIVDPTKKIENTLNNTFSRATSHIRERLVLYQHKIRYVREILSKNDVNKILEGGFIILTNSNGNILKNMEDVFNNNIIITHATGQYEVIIKNNNIKTPTSTTSKKIICNKNTKSIKKVEK
jgi:exodeoxyribonuclease VII large subunit